MGDLFWYPWYIERFDRSTYGWSVTARGVYRELLDAQWKLGGLPIDPSELRVLVHATPEEWKIAWKRCEEKFPIVDGHRVNERLDIIKAETLEKTTKTKGKARDAATERWRRYRQSKAASDASSNAQSNAPSINNDAPSIAPSNAILHPTSINQTSSDLRGDKSPRGNGSEIAHVHRREHDLPVPPNYPADLERVKREALATIRARLKPPNLE